MNATEMSKGASQDGVTYYAMLTVIKANLRMFSTEIRQQVLDLAMQLAESPPTESENRLKSAMNYGDVL